MVIMALYSCLLILAVMFLQADCFPRGAPISTCFTQYPKHNTGTQITPSPFEFKFTPSKYTPGQTVTIEVTDTTGADFVGFQTAVRRSSGNEEEIVGRFTQWPTDKIHAFDCFGGYQNMISHSNKNPVKTLSFKWTAPTENVGNVYFRSTVLRKYDVFWYNVMDTLEVDTLGTTVNSTYPMIPMTSFAQTVDLEKCGDTKGCFYYPRQCSGSNCIVAAAYQYRSITKDFLFELYSNYDTDYISLGFSDDRVMGQDLTVSCTGRNGKVSVQEGWNPGHYNERFLNTFSSNHQVAYLDGKLQCKFVLPQSFEYYQVDQNLTSFQYSENPFDLQKTWYLMLAWGEAMPESSVLAHHHDLPALSTSRIDLKEKVISYSSAFDDMVRAHGSVMIVAWILLAGIVTVVSRHYRDWLPRTRWFGTKVWFQIHRGIAILVAALTAIGIILIFVHYGTGIRKYADPHAYVGLAVVACVGLQIIGGMLRPNGDANMRPYFNWGHRLLGHSAHILAAATMFLAFDISYINNEMKRFGFIVLSVWVAVQVLWHLLFEFISRRHIAPEKADSYAMNDGNAKPAEQEAKKCDKMYSVIAVVYILTLIALCVAALVVFLLY